MVLRVLFSIGLFGTLMCAGLIFFVVSSCKNARF